MPHRIRHQLAIQCPPDLLERLRAVAAGQRRTVTSLALEWLEAGLAGRLGGADGGPGADQLVARIEALEAAVAALQRTPRPSPSRGSAPAPLPAERLAEAPDQAITTAELADLLQIRRGTLNARVRRGGGPAVGQVIEGWSCIGVVRPPMGGPDRALWEPITAA